MNKKRILKILGLLLLIIIIILCAHTTRNYIIVTKLQKNIAKYTQSTNFHIEIIQDTNNGKKITTNYYTKDGKKVVAIETTTDTETNKMTMYDNIERRCTYWDTANEKKAQIFKEDEEFFIEVQIFNNLDNDTTFQKIISCALAKIKSSGDLYIINHYTSPTTLSGVKKDEIYIEKDTGLLVKQIIDDETFLKKYEFDNVKDEIFVEPDINLYTIQ